jgi:virginiamycin B lyase
MLPSSWRPAVAPSIPVRTRLVLVVLAVLLGGCQATTTAVTSRPRIPTATAVPMHAIRSFLLPGTLIFPTAIAAGPDGNLWFTEGAMTGPTGSPDGAPPGRIGRITPRGQIADFVLPDAQGYPTSIAAGPDGNLWFTEFDTAGPSHIGRITPTGTISEFALPLSSLPEDITTGPDGALWFTEHWVQDPQISRPITHIGRITPAGALSEYALPPSTYAGSIALGPDGNLWFTDLSVDGPTGTIGRITVTGTVTLFAPPTTTTWPQDLTTGPDGNLWFTDASLVRGQPGKIGRITPAGSSVEFSLPGSADPLTGEALTGIAAGPDNAVWFVGSQDSLIGRVTAGGSISVFPLPTSNGQGSAQDIVAGPDGNLWFVASEQVGNGSVIRSEVGSIVP